MLDVFADVLADVLIPDGWRNRDGEVYGRWIVLLLAFAVVAPWSKVAETIDFLRAVNPVLALPVHDAVASEVGRPIYLRQSTALAPEGTEVRDWPADGLVDLVRS